MRSITPGASLLLLLAVVPAAPGLAQEEALTVDDRSAVLGGGPFELDRGPLDHLGWGTLEDLHVDLGGGAAVSLFSGNLVVYLRPFARADVVADSQLALTYNHIDPDGSPELAPGWTYDLGRFHAPGAWGDRVLVDADGFRDSFFVGDPPDNEEVRQVVDELVRAWRKETPLRQRRELGGVDAMRSMLAADPLFLSEMRMRFLGPAEVPDPPTGEKLTWRSSSRGERALQRLDRELVLSRVDGGFETYSMDGQLVSVEARGVRKIDLAREGGRLAEVSVGGSSLYRIAADSWGRFREIRSATGEEARFEYTGRALWRMETAAGQYRFDYDAVGRLTAVDGPRGRLQVRYDESTGRVVEASGPAATVSLGEPTGEHRIDVRAEIDGESFGCTWDPRTRLRRVESSAGTSSVTFEEGRPLPVAVEAAEGTFRFAWDDAGRLEESARGGVVTKWRRDGSGLLALVGPGGEKTTIERGVKGEILGWRDPEGRSTAVVLDGHGLPRQVARPGGLTVTAWRNDSGLLRSVSATGGEALELSRDARGYLRSVQSVVSGTAGARVDALGRLERFEAPSGLRLDVNAGDLGSLQDFAEGGRAVDLAYDADGLLVGWEGAGGVTTLERDDDGLVERSTGSGRVRWSVSRGTGGVLEGLERRGRPTVRFESDDGRIVGWTRADGSSFELLRRDDRVVAWESSDGRVELGLDRAGRVTSLLRGVGRWSLSRDSTGRVRSVADPAGVRTEVQLDVGGRPSVISTPDGIRWSLRNAPAGPLLELRGDDATWALRLGRGGRPVALEAPGDRSGSVRWDRAGRWSEAVAPGFDVIEAGWTDAGPARAGDVRWMLGPSGAVQAWGPAEELGGWRLDRDADGRVRRIDWQQGGGDRWARQEPTAVTIERDRGGRPLRLDGWELRWADAGLEELSRSNGELRSTWKLRFDRSGRTRELIGPAGRSVEITHDSAGDVRELALVAPDRKEAFSIGRDPAGRVESVTDDEGLRWELARDGLARVSSWTVGQRVVEFTPLDGTLPGGDTSLADALGVEVDDGPPKRHEASGSRRVRLGLADGATVIELDELRASSGALADVEGFWGSTSAAVLDQSPLVPASLDGASDPIADAIGSSSGALGWGPAVLWSSDGGAFVPAPDGRGVGQVAGWVRLAGDDGGTVAWIGPGATLTGLRLPSPVGAWRTPEGWLEYPAPPGLMDPTVAGTPTVAPPPGDARAVWRWWSALGVGADELVRLPSGVAADPRAWRSTRAAIRAEDALLPPEAPPAGAGAGVAPVPGAGRLAEGVPGVRRVSPLTSLVLSGDLPPAADDHRAFVAVPPPAWRIHVPGAAILSGLAARRAQPSVPPGWRREAVAGLAPGLDGILSPLGAAALEARTGDVGMLVEGLPAGTADVLPGLCAELPGAWGSLPVDGRCSSLEGLSDHPVVPGAARRRALDDDALVLTVAAMRVAQGDPLSGWIERAAAPEAWVIETASATRLVVDRRGRMLSVDLGGRLRRAAGRSVVAFVGEAVLRADGRPPAAGRVCAPAFLPEPSEVPESRWGLVPADPRFPVDALGRPALPDFTASSGLPDPDPAWLWPPLLR